MLTPEQRDNYPRIFFLDNIDPDAMNGLLDTACDNLVKEKVINIIKENNEVLGIYDLKTRLFGNKIYMDIEIVLDKNKTLIEGKNIANFIHDEIEKDIKEIKHCNINIIPN